MIRAESPASAAARASAALTVVLPTPPFPATMTTRDAAKNWAGSTLFPPFFLRRNVSRTLPSRRGTSVIGPGQLGFVLVLVGLLVGLVGLIAPAAASAQSSPDTTPSSTPDTRTGSTGTTSGVNDAGDQDTTADAGFVAVLKVSGLLDPVMVDTISKAV